MPHQALLMKARQSRIDALASLGTRPRTCRRPALFMSRRAAVGSETLDHLFLRYDTFVNASPVN